MTVSVMICARVLLGYLACSFSAKLFGILNFLSIQPTAKSFMRLEFLTFTQETVKLTVKTKKKANFLSFTSLSQGLRKANIDKLQRTVLEFQKCWRYLVYR